MLRIEWDRVNLENQMKSWKGISILDYWIPLWVYIDDIEISGLKGIPEGDVTHLITFLPELLSVIQLFDPEKLDKKDFIYERNVNENLITGGGFRFLVNHDETTDLLQINFISKGIQDWGTITIPLKEYTEGVLQATREIVLDIQRIAPEASVDDDGLLSLEKDYNMIRGWYEERYHEPVEEKYEIPNRFYP
jgi:hypothetical protein